MDVFFFTNNTWKLKSIIPPVNQQQEFMEWYFRSAKLVENSLMRSTINQKQQESVLGDFSKVTSLSIGKNVINDLTDLSQLILGRPQLESVQVDFATQDEKLLWRDTTATVLSPFIAIKQLAFENLTPPIDKELMFIEKTYPSLTSLSVGDQYPTTWPTTVRN